jgi:5-methylcytosine-specific restriction enzyme subunit McrC
VSSTLALREEEWSDFEPNSISPQAFDAVDELYGSQFETEYPNPKNGQRYRIRPGGYVGCFPVDDSLTLRVQPKVPIENLFRMLEYAYQLDVFLPKGLAAVDSIEDVFENLAAILAQRVNERCRKGLSRDYVLEEDQLSCVRGRFMFGATLHHALRGGVSVQCEFEEHTADLDENRILAWVLHQLGRFPLRRDEVKRQIRSAYRSLASTVGLQSYPPSACVGRFYDRLNIDYRPMHALCRFFLEQLGPATNIGSHETVPFRINMPLLFEVFVEKWLRAHLAKEVALDSQYTAHLDQEGSFEFRADLVLRDARSDGVLAVLDTKYKRSGDVSPEDVNQVFTYASRLHTGSAYLVYPSHATATRRITIEGIVIQSVRFDLSGDLEAAGKTFVQALGVPFRSAYAD